MAGYIGTKASVVSSGAERKKVFDITTTTTSLTGCSYTPNQVHVFHNGVRLVDGTDYTATDGSTVTLTTAAQNGDEVVVISYATFQTSDTVSASAGGTFSNAVTVNGNFSVDTDTLFVDAANNRVGVGTTSVSGILSVDGSMYAGPGSVSGVAYGFYPSSTYGNTGMFSPAANTVAFATTGGERMRIDGNGYLKCPGVYNDSAADSANVVVDASGNIYRSTSALKYKQDIRDIEEVDISRFRPVRYKSNLERDDPTRDHFGFIADEAHDAGYTELVSYGVLDEETGVAEVEGFRYDRMTVLLTKVIQQQQATIDALEARVATLEGGAA